jgi:cysteine synthase A
MLSSGIQKELGQYEGMIEQKTSIYIGLSFLAGVLLTLGFKDVYPDLERRYRQRRRLSVIKNRASIPWITQAVALEDHTKDDGQASPHVQIPEGIEGCIGNTPLFKIKSLSEETGCEILAKAEVRTSPFWPSPIHYTKT